MNKMFPVVESFSSVQGEGRYSGHPAFFLRVKECNLYGKCPVGCDTYYRIRHLPTMFIPYDTILEEGRKFDHIVITGGEPTLYPETVDLVKFLDENDISVVEIETNGYKLKEFIDQVAHITNLHVEYSPKTYNIEEIVDIVEYVRHRNMSIDVKMVVWDNPKIVNCVIGLVGKVPLILMPRGASPEELEENWPITLDLALKYNIPVSSRIHIYSRTL